MLVTVLHSFMCCSGDFHRSAAKSGVPSQPVPGSQSVSAAVWPELPQFSFQSTTVPPSILCPLYSLPILLLKKSEVSLSKMCTVFLPCSGNFPIFWGQTLSNIKHLSSATLSPVPVTKLFWLPALSACAHDTTFEIEHNGAPTACVCVCVSCTVTIFKHDLEETNQKQLDLMDSQFPPFLLWNPSMHWLVTVLDNMYLFGKHLKEETEGKYPSPWLAGWKLCSGTNLCFLARSLSWNDLPRDK